MGLVGYIDRGVKGAEFRYCRERGFDVFFVLVTEFVAPWMN